MTKINYVLQQHVSRIFLEQASNNFNWWVYSYHAFEIRVFFITFKKRWLPSSLQTWQFLDYDHDNKKMIFDYIHPQTWLTITLTDPDVRDVPSVQFISFSYSFLAKILTNNSFFCSKLRCWHPQGWEVLDLPLYLGLKL